jgi:hypothetical protein
MAFSGVLHGVNPGLAPIAVVVDQSGTLVLDRENWVTTSGLPLELPQAPDGRSLKIINSTKSAITVNSSPGTISGVTQTGAAIPAQNAVRILPGQRGTFASSAGNWIAQGCEPIALTFNYNGVPLSLNDGNPGRAGDLIHWLWGANGGANPAGSPLLTIAGRNLVAWGTNLSVLTDRTTTSSVLDQTILFSRQSTTAWVGFRFPGKLAPSGFVIQTNGVNNLYHPRALTIRVGNLETLTSDTNIAALPIAWAFTNQADITGVGQYFYRAVSTSLSGNCFVIQFPENGSNNEDYNALQQVFLFGDYDPY